MRITTAGKDILPTDSISCGTMVVYELALGGDTQLLSLGHQGQISKG